MDLSPGKKPDFEGVTISKMSKTRKKPSEWVGTTSTGARIHIVATTRELRVAVGPTLTEALMYAKRDQVAKVKHGGWTSSVSTDTMLEVTGLKLDCEVKDKTIA